MKTKWRLQHRPVLMKIVVLYDQGNTIIGISAFSPALGLTPDQVLESVQILCDARFIQAVEIDGETVVVRRVWPAAREVLAGLGDVSGLPEAAVCPLPEVDRVSSAYEQIVLGGVRKNSEERTGRDG